MALRLRAPAKLNLHLRVVGRRPDGHHELETVFHRLALHDDLYAERTTAAGVDLVVRDAVGSGLPVTAGDDNLVCRAARAVLAASAGDGGLRFLLHKRIPAGGGLGGGSSDAAAALRLGQALCGAPIDGARLAATALELGADVPFFLHDAPTMLGRGVGEILTPLALDTPELWFLLILPPYGTSTAAVFRNLEAQLITPSDANSIRSFAGDFRREIALSSSFRNDLETAAFRAQPELGRLRDAIASRGFPAVRMTGSGSTMFLSFDDAERARTARARLRDLAERFALRLLETRTTTSANEPTPADWPDDVDLAGRS